jgi:putative GTP pyrophosphokinase
VLGFLYINNIIMSGKINMQNSPPDKILFEAEYNKYLDTRQLIIHDLREQVEYLFSRFDFNIAVNGRVKNFESCYSKHIRYLKSGDNNPMIKDLLGIRVVCPFIEDIVVVENLIKENFIIEKKKKKDHVYSEFGYESTHICIDIPQSILDKRGEANVKIAEIQVRTILQNAWAEVEHELIYKVEFNPFDDPMRRKLAAINASLSLADIIFQELRNYQRSYSDELGKRRKSFFQKIEESTDDLLFTEENKEKEIPVSLIETKYSGTSYYDYSNVTIDDLLVSALSAHNQNRFDEAIGLYSRILEQKPDNTICSIIYKHRGMANFACSQYKDATDDFTSALKFDEQSYKSAYYRGVVRSVLKEYSQAIDDYTLSLKINPYQSFCLFRRAQAYYHIGDYPQALSDCENSLSLEPSNSSAVKFKELLLNKLRM